MGAPQHAPLEVAGRVSESCFVAGEPLVEALSDSIAAHLARAIELRGAASLVVCGGTTPRPLFERLSRASLPWSAVTITLTDERWVPPDSDQSNEFLVRGSLLVGRAAEARFVGLKTPDPTPEKAVGVCERALAPIPYPFDIVLLGMGKDGHFASLFPQDPGLDAALAASGDQLCVASRPATAPHPRLSLTLSALLDSRRVTVLITGKEKWRVYRRAARPGPVEELPIRAVLRQNQVDVDVYWAS